MIMKACTQCKRFSFLLELRFVIIKYGFVELIIFKKVDAMTKNIEIEFKTQISEEKYNALLHHFHLENNVFKQTNYYFDTDDYILNEKRVVLRIRQKSDTHYKVTLKSQSEQGAYESHVLITKEQALEMIENGFSTKEFFDDMDYFVTYRVNLINYRVSTPYDNGVLFLDRCEYCGVQDYEVEFEVSNYHDGELAFKRFLDKFEINQMPTKRKSERAFTCRR
jgi:uncharacterized protein YjbK